MSLIKILSSREIKRFDNLEAISIKEKSKFFVKREGERQDGRYYKKSAVLGFILLNGYFKSSHRFLKPEKFRREDIRYCCSLLDLDPQKYLGNSKWYKPRTALLHKIEILKMNGFKSFSDFKPDFKNEASSLLNKALKPKQIFFYLINFLEDGKVEIPEYGTIAAIITDALNELENKLILEIDQILDESDKTFLDDFMTLTVYEGEPSAHNPYVISTFKKPIQDISPTKISESVEEFQKISDLFKAFEFVFVNLKISDALVEYYANWMIIADQPQFNALKDPSRKYLYLLSLISNQYRVRQDLFVETFLKVVRSYKNKTDNAVNADFMNKKGTPSRHVQESKARIVQKVESDNKRLSKVKEILISDRLSPVQKIEAALKIVQVEPRLKDEILKEFNALENSLSTGLRDEMYYNKLQENSQTLSLRTKKLMFTINFNSKDSDSTIYDAVRHYKESRGSTGQNPPVQFLKNDQKKYLVTGDSFNARLYRCLLMLESAERIRDGSLNLTYSDQYRSINHFLIDEKTWAKDKSRLLERAKLLNLQNCDEALKNLSIKMDEQYHLTNGNVPNNSHLSFNKKGLPIIKTPKLEERTDELMDLFAPGQIIPLVRVLKEVSEVSGFLECFSHYSMKGSHKMPGDQALMAGLIGLGCNVGVRTMGKITKALNPDSLSNTVNWHFSKRNLELARSRVLGLMDELSLSGYFRNSIDKEHTSSDGQKFGVAVPSIHTNYSFKYLGRDRGVTAINFMSESRGSFYDTIISPSERESTYTLDGIIDSSDVESKIHSTDTHGFTEVLCGVCYSLGILFTPRLKNPGKQYIYTFKENKRSEYSDLGFKILPTYSKYINTQILKEQWDNLLRFLVTIRLQEVKPSILFKRLSSYSKTHPLYKALQELGRIHKTIFLLKYYDDVGLRQRTEGQLNKTELWHDFAKAVWFARNQKFRVGDRVSQELALASRNLIQNVIVAWNYLSLTRTLDKLPHAEVRSILDNLSPAKMIAWGHVNIHGEYDFDVLTRETDGFDVENLLKFDPSNY